MDELNIAQRQNDEDVLKYLAAARRLYTEAKFIHRLKFAGTLLLAAAAPVVLMLIPSWGPLLGAIAGLWVFVARVLLGPLEDRRKEIAVLAHEMFDTTVFELPWNRSLGRRPPEEDVSASARRLKDWTPLRDWYPDPGDARGADAVLIAQRTNAVWGRRLHRAYSWWIGAVASGWFIFGIVLAAAREASLTGYLVTVALPSLPALLDSVDTVKAHLGASMRRAHIEHATEDLLAPGPAAMEECRFVQDQIFLLRVAAPQVPDWLYARLRSTFEKDARDAATALARRLSERGRP